jgi:hypothetical protein
MTKSGPGRPGPGPDRAIPARGRRTGLRHTDLQTGDLMGPGGSLPVAWAPCGAPISTFWDLTAQRGGQGRGPGSPSANVMTAPAGWWGLLEMGRVLRLSVVDRVVGPAPGGQQRPPPGGTRGPSGQCRPLPGQSRRSRPANLDSGQAAGASNCSQAAHPVRQVARVLMVVNPSPTRTFSDSFNPTSPWRTFSGGVPATVTSRWSGYTVTHSTSSSIRTHPVPVFQPASCSAFVTSEMPFGGATESKSHFVPRRYSISRDSLERLVTYNRCVLTLTPATSSCDRHHRGYSKRTTGTGSDRDT